MSFDGQVLCQRMLTGPCALTIVGAATAAAAPAAAVFRKRRRVDVLSLDGAVMVFSPFLTPVPSRADRYLLPATQRLAAVFGKNDRQHATLRRGGMYRRKKFARRGNKAGGACHA